MDLYSIGSWSRFDFSILSQIENQPYERQLENNVLLQGLCVSVKSTNMPNRPRIDGNELNLECILWGYSSSIDRSLLGVYPVNPPHTLPAFYVLVLTLQYEVEVYTSHER